MPQLWLTYDELADALGCDAMEARGTTIRRSLTRESGSDGQTRVLMPRDLMQAYFRSHGADPSPAVRTTMLRPSRVA